MNEYVRDVMIRMQDKKHPVRHRIMPRWVLEDLIPAVVGQPRLGCEVGVWDGRTSYFLLKHFPTLHLYMVDKWERYEDKEGKGVISAKARSWIHVENAMRAAWKKTRKQRDRRTIIHGDSVAASHLIADGSLDFLFLDALHTYEGVKRDCPAWRKKIRPGGLFCGHDYGSKRHKGVKQAVDEYIAETGFDLHVIEVGQVWWYKNE